MTYESLPVNRPRVPVDTYHRDGLMRFDGNAGGAVSYEPNSMGGPVEDAKYKEPPLALAGDADRYDHRESNDNFTQAGILYWLMTGEQRDRLHRAIAGAMDGVPREIIERQLGHFAKADPAYTSGVKKALR